MSAGMIFLMEQIIFRQDVSSKLALPFDIHGIIN